MKCYRYELFKDGESTGMGIIRGISLLWLDEDLETSLLNGFSKMPIPAFFYQEHRGLKTKTYFTEWGRSELEGAIQRVLDVFRKDGTYEVREEVREIADEDIEYDDEWQVITVDHLQE